MKSRKTSVVRMSESSFQKLTEMVEEMSRVESDLGLNHSRLLSYVVIDFKERYFEKNKKRIANFHRDKKKDATNKLNALSEVELENVIRYLDKLNKEMTLS